MLWVKTFMVRTNYTFISESRILGHVVSTHDICLSKGQLCFDSQENPEFIPVKTLESITGDITSIAAGSQSSYIATDDGNVLACGLNDVGQLGDGTIDNSFGTTVDIEGIVSVFSGPSSKSAFFLNADERLYGTGRNNQGQLGVGDRDSRNVPVEIEFSDGDEIEDTHLSSSISHTLAW